MIDIKISRPISLLKAAAVGTVPANRCRKSERSPWSCKAALICSTVVACCSSQEGCALSRVTSSSCAFWFASSRHSGDSDCRSHSAPWSPSHQGVCRLQPMRCKTAADRLSTPRKLWRWQILSDKELLCATFWLVGFQRRQPPLLRMSK